MDKELAKHVEKTIYSEKSGGGSEEVRNTGNRIKDYLGTYLINMRRRDK